MNAFRFVLFLVAVLQFPACGAAPTAPESAESMVPAEAPCCRRPQAAAPPTGNSLYQLESKWTSDRERVVPLAQFRGRPVLLVLFFSRCEFACPILVHDLQRVEAALPPRVRRGTDVVLVSIDPENDTPVMLRRFRERHHLPMERWALLRGSAEDVRELAALLGVNYRRDERGQFAHSNVITLLDRDGVVAYQEFGLNGPVDSLVTHLTRLLAP